MERKKVMIGDFGAKKHEGKKITMLTAYDYSMARIVDDAGIDAILVGDSLGMVVLGYDSTVPVTMDEMIHHAKAARRGTRFAFLIGDMPFMSYQISKEEATARPLKIRSPTEACLQTCRALCRARRAPSPVSAFQPLASLSRDQA